MHTFEQLSSVLKYDPQSGEIVWIKRPANRVFIGKEAGAMKDGYKVIRYGRANYRAHRLAWLLMTGAWPKESIDHINGDRSDNRWSNLREADPSENMWNQRKRSDNASGVKGVRFWSDADAREYAIARLAVRGKVVQRYFSVNKLGRDEAFRLACSAVAEIRNAVHGEFANHAGEA